LFDRLATILAKRVLLRARRGLHASYVADRDELPYLRGALDLRDRLRRPWHPRLACEFEEHTRDIDDNRILAWTLYQILQAGWCSSETRRTVRGAFQAVAGAASVVPFPPAACIRRLYCRLNEDYEPLHALCRFFLEQIGPTHRLGDRRTLPFLLDMARLFELFVAEWLRAHLPASCRLAAQETVQFAEGALTFRIDLVLYHVESQEPFCILDTKYKDPMRLSEADVHQVIAYAEAMRCEEAVLIYPSAVPAAAPVRVGGKTVRRVSFALDGDLETAGAALLASLPLPAHPA
jgi:5-methylcytosine-specific restriction enzyme subunit McrC